jgi:integrase
MAEKATPRRRRAKTRTAGVYVTDRADGSTVHEITYTDSDGRQRWETVLGGQRAAEARKREVGGRKDRGEVVRPMPKLTFAVAAEKYMTAVAAGDARPNTIAAYGSSMRTHALPALGDRRLDQIDVSNVAALMARMRTSEYHTEVERRLGYRTPPATKGYAAQTINDTLRVVRGTFDYAARHLSWTGQNPADALLSNERPKHERPKRAIQTPKEIDRVLAELPTSPESEPYREAVACAAFLGLRIGELLALRWADFDFAAGEERVTISAQLPVGTHEREEIVKTDAGYRWIEVPAKLALMLRALRLRSPHSADTDYVLCDADGAPLKRRSTQRALDRALKAAAVRRFTFHGLRHSYGSRQVAAGVDLAKVARRMGHKNAAITLSIYTHEYQEAQADTASRAHLNTLWEVA